MTENQSTELDDLEAAADDIFRREVTRERRREAEAGGWSESLWKRLQEAGLTEVGSEAGLAAAAAVVRIAARHAAPVPIGETAILAGWILGEAGLEVPPGVLTVARLGEGKARAVPYGRQAAAVVAVSEAGVHVLRGGYSTTPGLNLADEPRDDLELQGEVPAAVPGPDWRAVEERGALLRSIQLAGALEAVLAMTATYATERRQFETPLLRFQAVQEQVALLAAEVAAARAAVEAAIAGGGWMAIAAAKIRTGTAAGVAFRVAHQVHGAIGFTDEHDLHHWTRRLAAWRDEYGTEHEWAERLGTALTEADYWEVSTR